ncbi:MAG: NAD(P)-dependent oxidoreductase [Cocleimonas sp.]|nr:NAD(P)-dependent oxidoreductase [Cocleimonas sp.]
MTIKLSFLGLGVMGYPMAGHLADHGFDVTVYNRTTEVATKWLAQYKGKQAETPREAVQGADVILTCVGNDQDVRSLYYGDGKEQHGIFSTLDDDTLLIDHTTTSAELAVELAQVAQQHHSHFIDAPLSGGQIGAEKGCLTIMVGGQIAIFQRAKTILNCYAQALTLVGKVGAGQRCKMVNQLCITGILQGLSEALHFAKAAGMDAETLVNTLQHGAAGSWQMVNRTKTMMNNEFDFGFAIDWMVKDLDICFDEAKRLNVELPLAQQVSQHYKKLQGQGDNRLDTSALIKQFDQ